MQVNGNVVGISACAQGKHHSWLAVSPIRAWPMNIKTPRIASDHMYRVRDLIGYDGAGGVLRVAPRYWLFHATIGVLRGIALAKP